MTIKEELKSKIIREGTVTPIVKLSDALEAITQIVGEIDLGINHSKKIYERVEGVSVKIFESGYQKALTELKSKII